MLHYQQCGGEEHWAEKSLPKHQLPRLPEVLLALIEFAHPFVVRVLHGLVREFGNQETATPGTFDYYRSPIAQIR